MLYETAAELHSAVFLFFCIDIDTTMCYYIAVVSNTGYKSYRIVRGDRIGEPDGNAQRRA